MVVGLRLHPFINPICGQIGRDSKNVSYVDVGLVQTCLDLIESWGWGGGGGGMGDSVRTLLSLGLNKTAMSRNQRVSTETNVKT